MEELIRDEIQEKNRQKLISKVRFFVIICPLLLLYFFADEKNQ